MLLSLIEIKMTAKRQLKKPTHTNILFVRLEREKNSRTEKRFHHNYSQMPAQSMKSFQFLAEFTRFICLLQNFFLPFDQLVFRNAVCRCHLQYGLRCNLQQSSGEAKRCKEPMKMKWYTQQKKKLPFSRAKSN